ncbi:MAG: hypothetical protein L0H53_15525 [Candidatus Nitrosocosmicus sp.]|nr:hypothetical protein [Candidatus Nitrosocosmicus sp.]MDN5867747.1 hypothetical protein [Candidatus Nitrosocosmicus sp.]
MTESDIIIESWQLVTGIIVFVITICGVTFAISKFIYTLKGEIKVIEIKLDNLNKDLKKQDDELKKITNLFQDAGFSIFMKIAKGVKSD